MREIEQLKGEIAELEKMVGDKERKRQETLLESMDP
jgi:hypothetical protein